MLNYNFSNTKPDNSVRVSFDPSRIVGKARTEEEQKNLRRASIEAGDSVGISGGKKTVVDMGLNQSLGKDERIHKLREAIKSGKISTFTEAADLINVTVSTVRRYNREESLGLVSKK